MAKTQVMPSILKQLALLRSAVGDKNSLISEQIKELEDIYKSINEAVKKIDNKIQSQNMQDLLAQAKVYCECTKDMNILREFVDSSEAIVAKEFWPFATYEQLFRRL
jgi:glutamine synthetase type III